MQFLLLTYHLLGGRGFRSREPSTGRTARNPKGGGPLWLVVAGVVMAHVVVGLFLLAAWLNGSSYFSRLIE